MTSDQYCILVAWASDELTEGQAAAMLGVDRITARAWLNEAKERSNQLWREHRAKHPQDEVSRRLRAQRDAEGE